jgi:hypothetical protein
MTRASINNFVGIFGRQAPIAGLEIPKWVTIFVDRIDEHEETEILDFIKELVEGIAVIGAAGVTVVFDVQASGWRSLIPEDYEKSIAEFVRQSRPYFRTVLTNVHALNHDPSLGAGKLMVLTSGRALPVVPEPLQGVEAVCIDYQTTLVAKTSKCDRLVRDAIEQVAEMDVRELPHWKDSLSSVLLNSATVLLALNVLCKPGRFETDVFFFAADYMDNIIANAFNDRTLRARWRKEKVVQTAEETNDAS